MRQQKTYRSSAGGGRSLTEVGTVRSQTQVLQIHLDPAEQWREGAGWSENSQRAKTKSVPPQPTRMITPPSNSGCKSHRGIVQLGTAASWQDKSTLVRRTVLHRHAGVGHAVIKAAIRKCREEDERITLLWLQNTTTNRRGAVVQL